MKTLYFDCFSGASGNMILGGLISLGIDEKLLRSEISKLDVGSFELDIERVNRSGINAVHVETVYPEESKHRHLPEIVRIINSSSLNERVKALSVAIFQRLANAEAKVHGIEPEKVHFHEVGAMDAIIDVVGACIGFEILEVKHFVCSKIHVGSGFVEMDHGRYPVPPPAVSELLRDVPVYSGEIEGELITPTGAAIIAELCTVYGGIPEMKLKNIGYGAGTRNYEGFPNALRLILGETEENVSDSTEDLMLLETNLDDCTGETLGFLMERALDLGAMDCWFTGIQMKKNRPGVLISILCGTACRENLFELLYTETSTIGIRTTHVERNCLVREIEPVETRYGMVDLKLAKFKGRIVNIKPEFDQMVAISESTGVDLKEIVYEVSALSAERYQGARIVETKTTSG